MQLSQKQKTFPKIFAAFLNSSWIFECLGKKYDFHSFCISEIADSENVIW